MGYMQFIEIKKFVWVIKQYSYIIYSNNRSNIEWIKTRPFCLISDILKWKKVLFICKAGIQEGVACHSSSCSLDYSLQGHSSCCCCWFKEDQEKKAMAQTIITTAFKKSGMTVHGFFQIKDF